MWGISIWGYMCVDVENCDHLHSVALLTNFSSINWFIYQQHIQLSISY